MPVAHASVRFRFPAFALGWLCLGVLAGALAGCRSPEPVRLLVITLDTLRPDHLGAYGYSRPTSPALDAFAAGATVFLDVTCSMPTTLPSHLTLFTGLTPAQHGVTRNGQVPPRDLTSIFELLAPRGTASAGIVAARVLEAPFLEGLGLGEVLLGDGSRPLEPQLPGEVITRQARTWLDRHGGGPFALWLHYYDVHEPYEPPAAYARRFAGDYSGPLGDALDGEFLVALNRPEVAAGLSAADRRHVVDLYDAELAYLDDQLGELFADLRRRGLFDSTLIVVVGDHGQAHGEAGFWGHGERLLEPVVRVPLLIKLPHQRQGRRVAAAVETLDLLPTLAELLGLTPPPGLTGRSLAAAWRDEALPAAPLRVVERRSYEDQPERQGIALLAARWKLTVYREPGEAATGGGVQRHLGRMDAAGGPDGEGPEGQNEPELAAEADLLLRQVLAEHRRQVAASGPPAGDVSAETVDMLRSLGYAR